MIYLDNNSTTRVDPAVLEAMLPYFCEQYGNAASSTHELGRQAKQAVDHARRVIADAIGARTNEICFTSGATESNNLAIRGACTHRSAKIRRMVSLSTEHRAVLDPVTRLGKEGFETVWVDDVQPDGSVPLGALQNALNQPTTLLSMMVANNEIGTILSLQDVLEFVPAETLIHSDVAQAFGRVPLHVTEVPVQLMSFSAHKIYGPKGIGALYVSRGTRLKPIVDGGGHEGGKRSGTLNVPAIVGFGRAVELMQENRESEEARIRELMHRCTRLMREQVGGVKLNGPSIDARLLGNLNFQIEGVDAEALTLQIPEVCISTGSACTSAEPEPSHVLRAIGLSETEARSSIRMGIGRFNTAEEIDLAVAQISQAVRDLRN